MLKRKSKIRLLLMAVLVAMLVLSACTDDKDEESSASPSQTVESQQPSEDGLPEGAIIEGEETFEVEEGKDGLENGFSEDVLLD